MPSDTKIERKYQSNSADTDPQIADRVKRRIEDNFHKTQFKGNRFTLRYHGRTYQGEVAVTQAVVNLPEKVVPQRVLQGTLSVLVESPTDYADRLAAYMLPTKTDKRFVRRLTREIEPLLPQDVQIPAWQYYF